MEEIMSYIDPKLFILVVFLYAVGLFLKLSPKFKAENEWKIPFILWAIGLLFTILWTCIVLGYGFAPAVVIAAIVQGTLIAAAAVFGNELIKQGTVKRNGSMVN